MLICLTPMFVAMISSFLILEERDERLSDFYQITPAEGYSYLFARIGLPMIWAFAVTMIVSKIFNISSLSTFTILDCSIISGFTGIFLAMMVVSIAGNRGGFDDPRGTLFFEIARLTAAKRPAYLLLENVPGLLNHDGGRTFAAILHALDGLGYGLEWQVLNSKDFGVPQSRKRVYLVGYLDERCRGKILPFTETAGTSLMQIRPGAQGERVYSPEGVSCTLAAQTGGFGGKTGLYEVGLPIKENTKKGYKMAYPGDSINLAYAQRNTRRGRVGRKIAHTLTTNSDQGTLEARAVLTPERETVRQNGRRIKSVEEPMFTLTAQDRHGVLFGGRIRRLTPRECLRLQGWTDDRIDIVLPLQSDAQLYKQAGNGVTVTVVEAIGKRLAAAHREVNAID